MIDKKLIPFGGLKKEPFSGSHHGMRYFFRGDAGKESTTFTVTIYPEPWCFEDTPDEEKESAVFPLSDFRYFRVFHSYLIIFKNSSESCHRRFTFLWYCIVINKEDDGCTYSLCARPLDFA